MLGRVRALLSRAAFRPDTLPADVVLAIALAPPAVAGLLIFHSRAALLLGIALVIGAGATYGAARAGIDVLLSPALAAFIAVALCGPAVSPFAAALAALAAAGLEVARLRFLPGFRIQTGLLSYVGIVLLARGSATAYLNPSSFQTYPEPIAFWQKFFLPLDGAPIDPIKLYVGNLAGPVFATSLLAVVIAVTWLWYARRFAPGAAIFFLVGAAVVIRMNRWDPIFQLDSGPLWFVGALILADKQNLPAASWLRPVIGFVAGIVALWLRTKSIGIEGAFFAVTGVLVLVGMLKGMAWALSLGIRALLARFKARGAAPGGDAMSSVS